MEGKLATRHLERGGLVLYDQKSRDFE